MSKLNKNSSTYIFTFAIVMTLVLGAILAFTSESLKETQAAEREFERKKFILSAALGRDEIETMASKNRKEVESIYDTRVKSLVVNSKGEEITDAKVNDIIIAKEYKLAPDDRKLPVYTIANENGSAIEFYVLPVYGFGLWDNIWGYISVKSDLNTVKGVIFDHKGETPGLGARITEAGVQARYADKKLYDESGALQTVVMQKGESGNYDADPHKVNGMTGATITGVGLNQMMKDYIALYDNYFKKSRK